MHRGPLTAILTMSLVFAQDARRIAAGWTSPPSADYEASLDHKVLHAGHASLVLRSLRAGAADYAARQDVRADAYRGKRVRLSGWVKPDHAENGGTLWLRVDMNNGDYILDSMLDLTARDQAAKDINGWTRCALVADVPQDALGISFGLRMKGTGEIWAGGLTFEVVAKSIPTTTIERRPYRVASGKEAALQQLRARYAKAPLRPVNLGFENP